MIYRKLKPEETTIQAGDVVAAAFHPRAVGEPAQTHLGGSAAIVLRPVPDEPEDVVRIEGEVCAVFRSHGVINQVNVALAHTPVPLDVTINQCVTLLIPRPDPPMPKCPYCGMDMDVSRCADGFRVKCQNASCAVTVWGPGRPTRREAIEAMSPKGGGQ